MHELGKSLIAESAYAAPAKILESLSAEAALAIPYPAIPHSIYAELWHTTLWQQISIDWVEDRPVPIPEHAADGFPADTTEPWDQLRNRFLAGATQAAAIAEDTSRLEVTVLCPTVGNPHRTMTVREQLESLAAHNAYHLGRIVLLRQLLNLWPPPSGGYTW